MSSIFLIIIFVIIFINIIKAAAKRQENGFAPRTNRRMWADAAFEHDLNILPPSGDSVFPSMHGMVDGLYTEIWGDFDENGKALVFCRVEFALSLPFHLCILKGNIPGESAGSGFNIDGITSDQVSVTASDKRELQKFLSGKNINILRNCVGIYPVVKITDTFLVLACSGLNDGISFCSFIERTVSAAKTFSGGHTVTMAPETMKPVPLTEDSHEILIPEQTIPEKKTPVFVPVVPPSEPLPEIVGQSSENVPESPADPVPEFEPAEKTPVFKPEKIQFEPALDEPEPAAGPERKDTVSLSAEELAAVLFSAAFPGEKEKQYFNGLIGKTVTWKGSLKSVYPYSSDFIFGKGPGTKATFEICEVGTGYGMKSKVKATVSLGENALQTLKGQTGKEYTFTGTLLKFEPFAKEILLEKGYLTE